MKKPSTLFFTALLCGASPAQSIVLPGTVAIQNSAYETGKRQFISDASIRAPLSKPATSDRVGQFKLEFAGVANGTPVRLAVSKPGFEVVNAREVQSVILGRIPAVEVLMADAQKLADAQMKYYKIATDGIAQSYHRKMTALNQENVALADRLAKFNVEHEREVSSLMDAIDVLTVERNKALGNAGELAERFATTDLDSASDLFRRAFELFQRGQLDSVLVLLSKDRLDAEYTSARATKEQANEQIRQVYKSSELKVSVLQSSMAHAEALTVLDGMEAMLKADPDAFTVNTEHELAFRRGNVLVSMSRYADAIAVYSRGRELVRTRFGVKDMAQLPFILKIAGCEQEMDDFDRSFELLHECEELVQGREDEEPLWVAELEYSLSRAYDHERDLVPAMAHAEKSLALRKANLEPDDERVIRAMHNIALVMRSQGLYEGTLELQLEMLKLAGPDGVNYGRGYGTLLHNIGQEYKTKGMFPEAEQYLRASLQREVKDLGPQHPHVFVNYISMAGLMDDLGREPEAIVLLDSAVVMNQGTVPADHNMMGYYFTTRASALSDLGDQVAAFEAVQRAVDIRLKVYGPKHPYLMATHEVMATIQSRNGDMEGAANTTSKMLDVCYETFGPDDINTHFVGTNKAGYLVELERDTAALNLYGRHLAPMIKVYGEQEPGMLAAQIKMATALYRTGDRDSSRVVFERINAMAPDHQAEWYLYKIAMDQQHESEALEHVMRSARLCDAETKDDHCTAVLNALKELAMRLGREDAIKEFED
jgi:tetratricopeptide (TPR) repeat protein